MASLRVLAVLFLSLLVSPVGAQKPCTAIVPGIVISYNPPAGNYHLSPNRTGRTFGMLTLLEPGDRIEVTGLTATLEVEDATEKVARYGTAGTPFCVREGPAPAWYTSVIGAFGARLGRAKDGSPHALRSRSGNASLEFDLDSLDAGTAILGQGTRPFAVSWRNGVAPFHVFVLTSSGSAILDEAMVRQRILSKSKPLVLAAGRYRISITDAEGSEITGSFIAAAPVFPAEDSIDSTDGARIQTVARVLTANPSRIFDAYCWLSPHLVRPTIRSLMDALADSDLPPPNQ